MQLKSRDLSKELDRSVVYKYTQTYDMQYAFLEC